MRRLVRWCVAALLLFAVLLVGVWGYAETRQWIFRDRTERLFHDAKKLNVQKSNWTDMQRFMSTWGAWGSYVGTCGAIECNYKVQLEQRFPEKWYPADDLPTHDSLRHILDSVGIRPANTFVGIEVRNNQVVSKTFAINLWSPGRYVKVGSSESPHLGLMPDEKLHPYYSLRRLKTGTLLAEFTPEASPQKQMELMDFRFRCVTSLTPCKKFQDLLPKAADELELQLERMNWTDAASSLPLWVQMRDQPLVFEGEVIHASILPIDYPDDGARNWDVRLKPIQILKSYQPIRGDAIFYVELSAKDFPPTPSGQFPYASLLVGAGTIFMDLSPDYGLECRFLCSVVPDTPENVVEAQRGVHADFAPEKLDW